MTKIVRQVARKDALEEINSNISHLASRISYAAKHFVDQESKYRKYRNFFGKGNRMDKYVNEDGEKLVKMVNELERLYDLRMTINCSRDEFVFMTDD